MAASQTVVEQMVTQTLNASAAGTFSSTIDPNNHQRVAAAITESVRGGALMIAQAIVANPAHIHRNLFVSGTPTALTHGGELSDMAGRFDIVEIKGDSAGTFKPGQVRDVQEISSFRDDTNFIYDTVAHDNAFSRNSGFYATANGRFYFTGDSAQGYFPIISRSTVMTLIPDEYESTWIKLSVGGSMKEGDNLFPIAQFYMNEGKNDLPVITQMGVVAPVPPYVRSKEVRGNP